ncbi:MAG: hypothetical protein OER83_06310 [Flavobacteriaceae bacterium]|nr:hypothetical protein [Flavobacteriaceae bacterium]MDH3796467.1 hypothetical protein [Flavobacteriaceae bacterium]
MKDYSTQIEIPVSREFVFNAISRDLGSWWGKQDRPIDAKGIVFKVSWGEPWYQFEVVDYWEGELMVWECIDANQIIPGLSGVEKEWVDTKVHWKLEELTPATTMLNFKHEGLIPDFLCFDFCSKSWEHFLKDHLISHILSK